MISFYPIGLLLGWYLGFKKAYGVVGLWVGVDVGYFVMVGMLLIYMSRVDWHEQARIAVKRSSSDAIPSHGSEEDEELEELDSRDAGERTRLVNSNQS